MNMCLDLNLATFQYIDGFGWYHFCLTRIRLELMIFFGTSSQLRFSFETARYCIDKSFSNPLRLLFVFV